MVLCFIALPIFAFLSIFSVRYRQLTLDALDCLFRTVSLRKCESGLDDKIRAGVSGTFLKFSPKLAKIFYKNYKIISWMVIILFIASFYFTSVGVYNYVKYGNCNGPESAGVCILDLESTKTCGTSDVDNKVDFGMFIKPTADANDPIIGQKDASLTIIEFGCYVCRYTKIAEPTLAKVIDYYGGKVNIVFKSYYHEGHDLSYESSVAAKCAQEQGRYAEYHIKLFEKQESLSEGSFAQIAKDIGMDMQQFNSCFSSDRYNEELQKNQVMGAHAGVLGTPTFFIGERKVVGSQPFKTFKTIIDEELKK